MGLFRKIPSDIVPAPRTIETIKFCVMDLGGQEVFQSTHRFFLTSNAIYVVLFRLDDPHTFGRVEYPIKQICRQKFSRFTYAFDSLRHWIQQIQAVIGNKNKPMIIIGTHADELLKRKQDPDTRMQEMISELRRNPEIVNGDVEIHSFIVVSMASGLGLDDLQKALIDIAKTHPQIGVTKVKVPSTIVALQQHMLFLVQKNEKHFMEWVEFEALCISKHIHKRPTYCCLYGGQALLKNGSLTFCDSENRYRGKK